MPREFPGFQASATLARSHGEKFSPPELAVAPEMDRELFAGYRVLFSSSPKEVSDLRCSLNGRLPPRRQRLELGIFAVGLELGGVEGLRIVKTFL